MTRITCLISIVVLSTVTIIFSSYTVEYFNSSAFANVCFVKNSSGNYTMVFTDISTCCDDGVFYCGFCYNDSQTNFTFDQAKMLAEANQSEDNATVVTSPTGKQITIYRRSTP